MGDDVLWIPLWVRAKSDLRCTEDIITQPEKNCEHMFTLLPCLPMITYDTLWLNICSQLKLRSETLQAFAKAYGHQWNVPIWTGLHTKRLPWAARYKSWPLIKLTPKGVIFPFSFSTKRFDCLMLVKIVLLCSHKIWLGHWAWTNTKQSRCLASMLVIWESPTTPHLHTICSSACVVSNSACSMYGHRILELRTTGSKQQRTARHICCRYIQEKTCHVVMAVSTIYEVVPTVAFQLHHGIHRHNNMACLLLNIGRQVLEMKILFLQAAQCLVVGAKHHVINWMWLDCADDVYMHAGQDLLEDPFDCKAYRQIISATWPKVVDINWYL